MPAGYLSRLARQTTEEFVRSGQLPAPLSTVPWEVRTQRACYISVLENPGRRSRAFYGTIFPAQPSLAHEVVTNTLAAIQRYANRPIRQADLSYLVYSVAVVGPLERITSAEHLNPNDYGLYIRSDRGRSAAVLPQRTGIETGDDQIATAYREAGVSPQRESITMYRFLVEYDE